MTAIIKIAVMPAPSKHSRRNPEPKKRRPSTVTIPENVGPHVKLLFAEMRRQNVTYDAVEIGSGVQRAALKAWRHRNVPSLTSLEAALGLLGWDFVPVPRAKALPPEIVEALRDVAARLDLTMPTTVQALIEIVAGIHGRFGDAPCPEPEAPARPAQPASRRRPRARREAIETAAPNPA